MVSANAGTENIDLCIPAERGVFFCLFDLHRTETADGSLQEAKGRALRAAALLRTATLLKTAAPVRMTEMLKTAALLKTAAPVRTDSRWCRSIGRRSAVGGSPRLRLRCRCSGRCCRYCGRSRRSRKKSASAGGFDRCCRYSAVRSGTRSSDCRRRRIPHRHTARGRHSRC